MSFTINVNNGSITEMDQKELIIMRHAKSDWQHELLSDFDRPLNERGLRDAPRMARWMASEKIKPVLLICSPALRARQTAAEIIDQLQIREDSVVFDKRMYLANVETLITILREIDDNIQSVLLIGHNPGLENLAVNLCSEELPLDSDGSLMTTANIVQIQLNSAWKNTETGTNKFIRLMRPKLLP